jgi:osmotically-inducible protein OsmY
MKRQTLLERLVREELDFEPSISADAIQVVAQDGVVALGGEVESYVQKWAATRAAQRVTGVRAVADEIIVKLPPGSRRTDIELANAAANSLEWNAAVPRNQVKIAVEDGWVTLTGQVDWQYQKASAARAIRQLIGVRGIDDEQLVVRPHAEVKDVKQRIEAALERHAVLDSERIRVETRGEEVTLRGSVPSWVEREQAEHAAWAAPGVSSVKNLIAVTGESTPVRQRRA